MTGTHAPRGLCLASALRSSCEERRLTPGGQPSVLGSTREHADGIVAMPLLPFVQRQPLELMARRSDSKLSRLSTSWRMPPHTRKGAGGADRSVVTTCTRETEKKTRRHDSDTSLAGNVFGVSCWTATLHAGLRDKRAAPCASPRRVTRENNRQTASCRRRPLWRSAWPAGPRSTADSLSFN